MSEFWNERFGASEYIYGKKPNDFFKQCVDKLPSGHILVPGAGEGRDAVYAAIQGWQVSAFDSSSAGKEKSAKLAEEFEVNIDYTLCDVRDFEAQPNTYDAIGITYFHLPEELRVPFHEKILEYLKPGGTVFMEMFTPEQLNNNSGGPKTLDLLYTRQLLTEDFKGLSSINIVESEILLNEGPFHQGKADVIRLIGRK